MFRSFTVTTMVVTVVLAIAVAALVSMDATPQTLDVVVGHSAGEMHGSTL